MAGGSLRVMWCCIFLLLLLLLPVWLSSGWPETNTNENRTQPRSFSANGKREK